MIIIFILSLSITITAQNNDDFEKRIDQLTDLDASSIPDTLVAVLTDLSSYDEAFYNKEQNRIYKIANRIKDPKAQIAILLNIASFDEEHTVENFHKALALSEKHELKEELCQTLINLAYYYKSNNKLDSAMLYSLQARELANKQDVNKEVAIKLLMADLFFWARFYDKAEQIYNEVLTLKGDSVPFYTWIYTTTINNLGMIELNRKNFDRARKYFNTSLEHRVSTDLIKYDSLSIGFIYYLLGETEFEDNDFKKAREYYNIGYPVAEKFEIREFKIYFALLNAKLLYEEGKTAESYKEVWEAFKLLEKENERLIGTYESKPQLASVLLNIYDLLINIQAAKGNTDSTLYYHNLYMKLEETLDMNTSYSAYIQMLAEKDHEILRSELNKVNMQRKIVMYGFGIVFLILIIMFELYRRIRSIKKKLTEKHNELIKTNSVLLTTTEELNKSNQAKDKFFSVLAHDLKNPFSGLKGFDEFLIESLEAKDYEHAKEYASIIRITTDLTYDLLINLLDWSRIHSGRISFSGELINIDSVFSKTIANQKSQAEFKGIVIDYHAEKDAVMMGDKNMIMTILRNLLSNSIKACGEGCRISITHSLTENNHIISVKDTGSGMSHDKVSQLVSPGLSSSSTGNQREGDSGIGMFLVKDFLEYHNGTLEILSEPGKGTEVVLTIPVNRKS